MRRLDDETLQALLGQDDDDADSGDNEQGNEEDDEDIDEEDLEGVLSLSPLLAVHQPESDYSARHLIYVYTYRNYRQFAFIAKQSQKRNTV